MYSSRRTQFLTASHPDESEFLSKPEPLEESPPQEEYEPNFFDDDDEFDRILLYVLLAQEPSDLAPLRRWRFRRLALFFSLLDVSSLIVSILGKFDGDGVEVLRL